MKEKIFQIIKSELSNPTLDMTKQILAVLDIGIVEDSFKIEKIDIEQQNAIAYVKIKKANFYLRFVVNIEGSIDLFSVETMPFIEVVFFPTSETLTVEELQKNTKIQPQRIVKKGEYFAGNKIQYNYNGLEFKSLNGPGNITSKLNALLSLLEKDTNGIKALALQTNCFDLFVTISYYIGNRNFTGLWLEKEIINRLSEFGFELTFDIYAEGEVFKDE